LDAEVVVVAEAWRACGVVERESGSPMDVGFGGAISHIFHLEPIEQIILFHSLIPCTLDRN
jgi:hypothetical protein